MMNFPNLKSLTRTERVLGKQEIMGIIFLLLDLKVHCKLTW